MPEPKSRHLSPLCISCIRALAFRAELFHSILSPYLLQLLILEKLITTRGPLNNRCVELCYVISVVSHLSLLFSTLFSLLDIQLTLGLRSLHIHMRHDALNIYCYTYILAIHKSIAANHHGQLLYLNLGN